jgi:hypothetical protein
MATARVGQFQHDASRTRDLIGLGQAIGNMTCGRVDASDLFRSALVQAVAALDAYVHGVTLDRAVDILLGRIPGGVPRGKVGLHFTAVQALLAAATPADTELAARTYVAQRLALETFQRPDDIANALAMVGISKIWSTAFPANPAGTKTALGLIVDRRNRIVHSCDGDPLNPGSVTHMFADDAVLAIETIETIVLSIDPLC